MCKCTNKNSNIAFWGFEKGWRQAKEIQQYKFRYPRAASKQRLISLYILKMSRVCVSQKTMLKA